MTSTSPTDSSLFARLIREIRVDRELSQEDFAHACGVTQPAVAMWESGSRSLNTRTLEKIALGLHVPLLQLLYHPMRRLYAREQRARARRKH